MRNPWVYSVIKLGHGKGLKKADTHTDTQTSANDYMDIHFVDKLQF